MDGAVSLAVAVSLAEAVGEAVSVDEAVALAVAVDGEVVAVFSSAHAIASAARATISRMAGRASRAWIRDIDKVSSN